MLSAELIAILSVGVALGGLILRGQAEMRQRISALETRIGMLEARTGAVEQRMARLEGVLQGLQWSGLRQAEHPAAAPQPQQS